MRSLRVRQWKIDADFHARTKTATAAGNADAGNTHILALKPRSVNLSISTPAGAQPNDVMIAAVGFNNSSAAVTAPSGWTLVRRINNASTTSNALAAYRRTAQAGEPSSHAWAIAGGTFLVGGIQAFSGVDTANPVDVENGQSTPSGTIHDTPSVTTSTANSMLVTAHTYASSNTWTPQSGLTEGFDRPSGAASATGQSIAGNYQLQAAAGASGTKRSTAAGSADVGNTHILALRRFIPNVPPTVSLTSPANGATFTAPASVTLTATAADSDGTVSKVEFFHGGTNLIATVTSPPYTFNWTNVAAGSYTLTAKATDNLTAATTSAPVNITVTAPTALYFIHPDHLNTPRVITNQAQQVVWRWDNNDAFGGNMASENPGGLGVVTFNLRFPGQYFDSETNNHYNYYRDYSPEIGRYVESDPIGLRGGNNTYAYSFNSPQRFTDPTGLDAIITYFPGGPGHIGVGINSANTSGLYPLNRSIAMAFCGDVPGAVLQDRDRQDATSRAKSRSVTIETTPAQDANMQAFIDSVRNNVQQKYNLCKNQCTNFVRGILEAGGIVVPGDDIVPIRFFEQIESAYGGRQ